MVSIADEHIWMIVVGFIAAFLLAFGIGANDVANSFGTSVGAKVLTLRQACILGSIFEILGAVLLGGKVSYTIWKIVDVTLYQNNTELLMIGNMAALSGSFVWMLGTTLLRIPISGTHTIVGALIGFALVTSGSKGVNWVQVGKIVGCWFWSPLLSGLVSVLLFFVCKYLILSKKNPLEPGLKILPVFYALTITVNVFSVFYDGPKLLGFDRIPLWGIFILSFGSGFISAVIVRIFIVPWQRKRITAQCPEDHTSYTLMEGADTTTMCQNSGKDIGAHSTSQRKTSKLTMDVIKWKSPQPQEKKQRKEENSEKASGLNGIQSSAKKKFIKVESAEDAPRKLSVDKYPEIEIDHEEGKRDLVKDHPQTVQLFSFLQILTAVFGAFAHGGNDVSNAIGPLVIMWMIGAQLKPDSEAPLWMLFYGGIGISVGLWIWGRRLIKTIGEDLAKVTPSSGFCIELGSALTTMVASNIALPISTTQCKVASVVAVGRFRTRENVDWSIFRNICLAWLITFPVTSAVSAAMVTALNTAISPV